MTAPLTWAADGGDVHRQPFRDEHARVQAHRYLPRLASAGLTPEILDLSAMAVATRRGRPFRDWWPRADRTVLAVMRASILDLIESVHALGICHRDLHDGNLILDRDHRPLVIDLEWACDVDPRLPCYDLTGPTLEVPIPDAHRRQVGTPYANGVWWGNPLGSGYRSLGEIFGALDTTPSR